jgi:eukaryotic-like serine/threonine-protein kinase
MRTDHVDVATFSAAIGTVRENLRAPLSLLRESEIQPLRSGLQSLERVIQSSGSSGSVPRIHLKPSLESIISAFPPRLLPDISVDFFDTGKVLGRGGCSRIHKGKDLRTGKDVAIKIVEIPTDVDPPPTQEALDHSLREEYDLLARLKPGTAPAVLRFGTLNGQTCMVIEFLEGEDLSHQGAQLLHNINGDRDVNRLIDISLQAVEQVAALHAQGLVHCDVKAENFKYHNGRLRIFDFGIATPHGREHGTGINGTPAYMPPEAWRSPVNLYGRDVFALGSMHYWMWTGAVPFEADTSWEDTRAMIMDVDLKPDPPSQVLFDPRHRPDLLKKLSPSTLARLEALDAIILRALDKDPGRRFQNASEMRAEFRKIAPRPLTPFANLMAMGVRRKDGTSG